MILGMMQPYFYPYLGYWQLMNMVDEYIIYDDVNYIKGGWINRNRIKINGSDAMISIPIRKASQNRKINEHEIAMNQEVRDKLVNTVKNAYAKAPYRDDVLRLFEETVYCEKTNLAEFLAYCNRKVAEYMGITTPIYSATELKLDHTLRSEDRIIDICKQRGITSYINAIGGKELYSEQDFENNGIELGFLRMDNDIVYPQGKGDFIPGLSILDVLMYNSKEEIKELLNRFTLEK